MIEYWKLISEQLNKVKQQLEKKKLSPFPQNELKMKSKNLKREMKLRNT